MSRGHSGQGGKGTGERTEMRGAERSTLPDPDPQHGCEKSLLVTYICGLVALGYQISHELLSTEGEMAYPGREAAETTWEKKSKDEENSSSHQPFLHTIPNHVCLIN